MDSNEQVRPRSAVSGQYVSDTAGKANKDETVWLTEEHLSDFMKEWKRLGLAIEKASNVPPSAERAKEIDTLTMDAVRRVQNIEEPEVEC